MDQTLAFWEVHDGEDDGRIILGKDQASYPTHPGIKYPAQDPSV